MFGIDSKFPSVQEIAKEAKKHLIYAWDTRFNFLKATNGVRPGCLTGLMGSTHSGKSTLLKSIISDCSKEKVLVWLTEENSRVYSEGILRATPNDNEANLQNITFVNESELDYELRKSADDMFTCLEAEITQSCCTICFIDNLSTSALYMSSKGFSGEADAAKRLHALTKKLGVAIFYIIHTAKGINNDMNRLITGEDIRGSNMGFMVTEYFYVMQRFSGSFGAGTNKEKYFPFITIKKHRYHNRIKNDTFQLRYEQDLGVFIEDRASSFDEINKAFMIRNYLGKRNEKR